MRLRHSLDGRLALLAACAAASAALLTAVAGFLLGTWSLALLLALLIALPLTFYAARRVAQPLVRTLRAVTDGVTSMRDNDFSVSITRRHDDELGRLVDSYNALGALLRQERQTLYQRELLLDTVIQSTPLALVLTNAGGAIIYSNLAARQLLAGGRKLEGRSFPVLLESAPETLRQAVASGRDALFTLELDGESEILHGSQRRFVLNAQPHFLHLFKRLTRELAKQEVRTWKKVIRVISHELNNSLAPISSLAHSGRSLALQPDRERLEQIFATIEERARHLHSFIDGYARFAKLPRPRVEAVNWSSFLGALGQAASFRIGGPLPMRPARFDPAQIEQVLINLLKNSREAGAPADDIEVVVAERAAGWRLDVLDRGSGMSEPVLADALLPFFSTKPGGSGLGLTLCREIVEAHGGRLSLANRKDGGLAVTLWLPFEPVDET